jgi:hypothetical protein
MISQSVAQESDVAETLEQLFTRFAGTRLPLTTQL